jgi:methyl-accepting chemotaxis protein
MRLKHQVMVLLGILIGLLLMVSLVSYNGNSRTTYALGNVAEWYVPLNAQITDATKVQLTSSLALQTVLNSQDVDEIEAAESRFATTNQTVESGLSSAINQLDAAKEAIADEQTVNFLDNVEAQVKTAQQAFETFQANATGLIESLNSGDLGAAFDQMSNAQSAESTMLDALDGAYQDISTFTEETSAQARADADSTLNFLVMLSVIAVLVSVAVGWFGLRRLMQGLGRDPNEIRQLGQAIADGKLDEGGEVDNEQGIYASLLSMRDQLRGRIEAERKQAAESMRIKVALDNVSTNIMVANADHEIIYLNGAMQETFRANEKVMQQALPTFKANHLTGEDIHQFHKDPARIRQVLAGMKAGDIHEGTVRIGGCIYDLTVGPVIDENGDALGFVVEWKDRTIEDAIQKEVDSIVRRARAGDLSRRAEVEGKEGFFLSLSEGLNGLLSSTESAIQDTARVLSALAKGDLSQTIDQDYQGLFAELKRDANLTTEKLRDIIAQIQEASDLVSTGAEEISQGNHSLSSRTEQQAASLEETASSMEQMTATVRQSADHAKHANQLAISASEKAQSGGAVVQNAVTAMDEINVSSRKIADITSVIDSIAFQTNLLALNAAVEAARAGEQGRGFAVVASEVRNLAQRSATAAREINELIDTSVEKIEAGSKLVNQSGETLGEIVDAVKRVADMIAEIAAASEEQTQGIEEVNRAVSQMDEMTQQNAALVEEAAAASQNMGVQARDLTQMVGFFSGVPGRSEAQLKTDTVETTAAKAPKERKALPDQTAASKTPAQESVSARAKPKAKKQPAEAPPPAASNDDDEWDEF